MNTAISDLKKELKSKLQFWNNLKSRKAKAALILVFVALITLKIFTTVLTFDWLIEFLN
ncbi:MAG: hypothetical protein HRU25_11490 [Psychrobium sp.]|nr:hypothetical protein [Psychrobium sp.]